MSKQEYDRLAADLCPLFLELRLQFSEISRLWYERRQERFREGGVDCPQLGQPSPSQPQQVE